MGSNRYGPSASSRTFAGSVVDFTKTPGQPDTPVVVGGSLEGTRHRPNLVS
jgi:hypothetical protein